jgi:IS5 family transposase
MAAVTELVQRLGVVAAVDAAVGPIKARDRRHTAGQLLVGVAAAQLAGEDFTVQRITGELAGLAERAAADAQRLLTNARRALHRAQRKAVSGWSAVRWPGWSSRVIG